MNGIPGTMSPVSLSGSDWSGINSYQKPDGQPNSASSSVFPPTPGNDEPSPQLPESPSSPPSSVAGRSSSGTLSEQQQARRQRMMEDSLARHYTVFQRFLHASQRDLRAGPRSDRAKDKLLRLSPTQFYELSTDVYDELLRRQNATTPPPPPPASNGHPGHRWPDPHRHSVPPYLPPRKEFHVKRNQARQKLSTLQHQRFRDLAMDVFRELERRFPQFRSRRPLNAPAPGYGPPPQSPGPNGYAYPPPRPKSRGGVRQPNHLPPRQGSLSSRVRPPPPLGGIGGGSRGLNGDSNDKSTFQNNTIVPNKSTLVEDDEEDEGTVADSDRDTLYGLDSSFSRNRSGTTTTIDDGERKLLQEAQSQVSSLQEQVQSLENLVRSKDEQMELLQEEQDKSQVCLCPR